MAIKAKSGGATGFLARLKRAEAGNVLPMMAMAIIPIAGMIGSGLDMSRAYLVKAKLQTACDSTALATRRFMAGNPFDDEADSEGRRFFQFNFPENTMGSAPVDLELGVNATNTDVVEVSASTTVPTSLMRIFGKASLPVTVSCDADQDFVHNDIMIVVDVTGSMNCQIGGGAGCTDTQGASPTSRVSALRGAARQLYLAMADADDGVVTRFGFMPYSVVTNVGRDVPAAYVRTTGLKYHTVSGNNYNTQTDQSQTSTWMSNWKGSWSSSMNPASWGYRGCVEERSSYSLRTNADLTVESAVSQEDIDHVPGATENTLKWVPYDPERVSWRSGGGEFCPAPASRLAEVGSEAEFQTRLNNAIRTRAGNTHHDVGMIWGMRYLSPTGMFAADNPTQRDAMRVDKHIIFFTDGQTAVGADWYSAVGVPNARRRTTGSGSDAARAIARFQSACNRARQMDMTVWVVALDLGFADPNLGNCANSSDHFFAPESPEELADAFDTIGREIGKLRLTK